MAGFTTYSSLFEVKYLKPAICFWAIVLIEVPIGLYDWSLTRSDNDITMSNLIDVSRYVLVRAPV
jgi:hypothetical protein